ncbi:MAG: PAS domain-containing sensor histidine kinase [Melioribacteraceae bacterium]|nr:PAS domain-containing sensor histidine kinase [Melioribacteraceae bacterium]
MNIINEILLVGFPNEFKNDLKVQFSNSSFKNAKFHETEKVADVLNSEYWNQLDLIVKYGNPNESFILESFKNVINIIPTLFIYDNSEKANFANDISDLFDSIPKKEFSPYILEKCVFNLIEKSKFRNKLIELENAQKEKFQNEERFRDLFDNSAVGMYEVDKDGNFLLANQVFFDILGLNNSSDLNKLNAFKKGISTNGTREKIQKLLDKNDKIINLEDEWLKADNTKIIVKENIRVKKDSNGNIQYYQGVVEDISSRKFVEAELVKSKKDAEKSDRLKSEFLTQISHEIRTPVNTLLSFVALIEDELQASLSEELIGCFEHLNKAGRRITRTIDLLIKMSELHTDNYDPEFKENNLFELIEELVNIYKPQAEEKNINLEFIKAIDNANIIFDKLTVYDIFSNIIDNAIKYTDEGSVKIYIKNTLLNKISVTVIDTGVGISEKYISNIFQPFSQETSGYTRKFDGNGLGLALVKEYCNLNNAEVFVSSEKNLGSNFTVIFK